MPKDFDIVVVGDVNPDLILTAVDIVPQFGQVEKWIDNAELTVGGSAGIFACGAARLGLRTALIGKVGVDEFGFFMRDRMRACGVDTCGLVMDASIKTGLGISLSNGNDRAILTFGGSIPLLNLADIDFELIRRARHFHSASYYLLDQLRPDLPEIYRKAQEMGLTTSIDTNYDPKERWGAGIADVLDHTTLFIPNMTELLAISSMTECETALQTLQNGRNLTIVVKNGEDGAFARCGTTDYHSASIAVEPIDTTGAGDSFDAGFLYGYLNDLPLECALRCGCICGALSTQGLGGTAAQADLKTLQKVLEVHL